MNSRIIIDYKKIVEAKNYYEAHGFNEIAVPWIISFDAYIATKFNISTRDFYTLDGYLNASGEQGFIDLMLNSEKLNKNLCITPCFRDDLVDEIHFKYFLKLELIDTSATEGNLFNMIQIAKRYFDLYLPNNKKSKIVKTGDFSFDIESFDGVELGSYGFRRFRDFKWIYGTGLALPRLDIVSKKNQPTAGR